MGRNVQHVRRRSTIAPGDAERVRALLLARLHKRGWPLERIATVLGSSSSTVCRRLAELTPERLAELESTDLGGLL